MTLDEQIVAGIEQILYDYRGDFFIQKKLETGETFPLFQVGEGCKCVLHQDGIHYFTNFNIDLGVMPIQQVARDYYIKYVRESFKPEIDVPLSVTGVKYQLLKDLEERANEFRKFDC